MQLLGNWDFPLEYWDATIRILGNFNDLKLFRDSIFPLS